MAGFPLLWSSSAISQDNPWCQLSTGPSSTSQTSCAEHNLKPIWLLEHSNLGVLKLLELIGAASKTQTSNHSLFSAKPDWSNTHHSSHPLDTGYQPLQILLFKSSWNFKQTCSSKALIHGALQSKEKQLRSHGISSWIHRREINGTYFSKIMSYPEETAGVFWSNCCLVQLLLSKEEPVQNPPRSKGPSLSRHRDSTNKMLVTVPRRCWDGCSACQDSRMTLPILAGVTPECQDHLIMEISCSYRALLDKQGSINPWPLWAHSRGSSAPHLLCPGWMTNTVPGLSKESDLSPPGDQAMSSGRQSCASGPAQFLSVKATTCQLRFNWAWYAGQHLCQKKWELWTCDAAEEFLILFWRVYPVVLLLSPARAPLFISLAASAVSISIPQNQEKTRAFS